MNLAGRLRLTTLGDVLGALHRDGATGVLELTDQAGRVHRVHVVSGRVGWVESSAAASRNERLERLFQLGDARLAFRVARGQTPEVPTLLEPRDFLLGRPRARDRGLSEPRLHPGTRRDPVRTRALATLGLGDAADPSSVQRAFRTLAAQIHPDRFPTAPPSERATLVKRFAELSAAYHTLVA